jgi:tetratricopeptide (TPR) repeat protein
MSKQKNEAVNLIEKANYEFFKHNYDKSLTMYQEILEKFSTKISTDMAAKIEFKIALIFENIQCWEEEIKYLESAMSKESQITEKCLIKKSSALMRLHQFEDALELLNSLKISNDSSEISTIKRLITICTHKIQFEKENPTNSIPEEIWTDIFLFLNVKEVTNLSLGNLNPNSIF